MLGAIAAGTLSAFAVLAVWGFIFSMMWSFWYLAQYDLFFTPNTEGTAKAILRNGKFYRCIGALQGHAFYDPTGKSGEKSWDVIPVPQPPAGANASAKDRGRRFARATKEKLCAIFGLRLLDGLEWVGIPPFYSVYTYQFKWSVLKIEKSGGKAPETKSERLSYILLQQVVYLITVTRAETSELIPMDASIILTVSVVNPYKALFAIHNWLEAISDQVSATMRSVIGTVTFKQLTEARNTASSELEKKIEDRKKEIEENYGVRILIPQIQSVDPSEEVAKKVRELSLEGYAAEQEAVAIRTRAAAEKDRIDAVYGTVIRHGGAGAQIRFAEALEKTRVSVITGGGPVIPSFQIPGSFVNQEEKKEQKPEPKNKKQKEKK